MGDGGIFYLFLTGCKNKAQNKAHGGKHDSDFGS